MVRPAPYAIILSESLKDDLRHVDRKWHGTIRESIFEQLRFTPNVATRNRKKLRVPIRTAAWELRCGPGNRVRVLYQCDESKRVVQIVAVGEKRANELWIQGEKVAP